ncbi:MAG: type I methionyl aminopeptidase [Alkalispirochaeta sp.]
MIRIKTARQIEGIRESCHLLAEVLEILEEAVKPGITTSDLDEIATNEITMRGGRPAFLGYQGFPGALCTSVNEEVIHGIPGNRRLNPGDVVSIDCGIEYNGYYSDSAITVPVGTPSPDVQRLLTVTRNSLEDGIAAAVVGNRVNDISRAIYRTISVEGYGIVRPYCGHGVGLSLHEDPQIPNYVGRGPNPRLKHGMVIAIEPMVNLGVDDVDVLDDDWTVVTGDRSISAHFEHTVAIFRDHTEVLTRRAHEVVHSGVEASTV